MQTLCSQTQTVTLLPYGGKAGRVRGASRHRGWPQGSGCCSFDRYAPSWNATCTQVYNYNLLNETRWRSDALKTIRNYRQGMVMTGPSL